MKKDNTLFAALMLVLISVLIALVMISCSDEQSFKRADNVKFSVGVYSGHVGCLDDYVFVAIVDDLDKLNWAKRFDCYGQNGGAYLLPGDVLELRVTTEATLDKSIIYQYRIERDGNVITELADYTGISIIVP